MEIIKKFEEMEMWQDARVLCKKIYVLTNHLDFAKDFSLKDQIRRLSGSVMDNIAEGFDRGGRREFIQFLAISQGSLSETKSQLYRAYDQNYIVETELNDTLTLTNKVGNQIGGFMKYLQQSEYKGHKFKEEATEYHINLNN